MKHLKKIVSLLLTAVMVLAMCIPVMADAAKTYNITAPNTTHQYEIYQIFTGELSGTTISNVKWGKNGKGGAEGTPVDEAIINELTAVNSSSDIKKLEVIEKYVNLTDPVDTITGGATYKAPEGYYLIKDKDGSVTGDDAYTTYIVKVAQDTTITPKSAKPEIDKQVKDENSDAEVGAEDGWGETADHAINESFQFKLTATLPNESDLDDYEHYYLEFEDVLGKGVTFEQIDSVIVHGIKDSAAQDFNATYVLSENAKNGLKGPDAKWTLSIMDLKAYIDDLKNAKVTVIYSAHLNEEAEVINTSTDSTDNNQNKAKLIYSNNPNATGDGTKKPSDTGNTEYDWVFVLTYEADNTKYKDEVKDGNELKDAGFRLYSDKTCTQEVLLKKVGDVYYPIKADETANAVEMKSAENGTFNIKGLDAGTYYLRETSTPTGYNTVKDMKIEIGAVHSENATGVTAKVELTKKLDGKDYTINNVVNKSGSQLPETGGIGTTIFYVVGVILMLGAGVLLVTKKRMSSNR